ncbi:hypothetical protein Tsubulata_035106 [Turnera subulata]|uniref:Myb/SANT-like domain-containing protein n=1 Tax=Turnera subulata TaxID=218843 RepID=A0A9Q0FB21_9ROSI|nr:hypothetical protein Tsubulata_035106 [Turnera subulata]
MENMTHDGLADEEDVIEPEDEEGVWIGKFESHFICLMEDQVKKGNKQGPTFSKSTWITIRDDMKRLTGKEYAKEQLRNKFNTLKARWRAFNKLLAEPGAVYHAKTFRIIATEEVWQRLYKVEKLAKRFKKKGCRHFDKLCTIYGDAVAISKSPSPVKGSENNDQEFNISDEDNEGTHRGKRVKTSAGSENDHQKERGDLQVATPQDLFATKENSKKKETLEKIGCSSVADSGDACGYHTRQDYSIVKECMSALNSLEDVDGASYTKATRYIHDDPLWREMFLYMPRERKRDWVLNIGKL